MTRESTRVRGRGKGKARCSGGSAQRALPDCSPCRPTPGRHEHGSHRPVRRPYPVSASGLNRPDGPSFQPGNARDRARETRIPDRSSRPRRLSTRDRRIPIIRDAQNRGRAVSTADQALFFNAIPLLALGALLGVVAVRARAAARPGGGGRCPRRAARSRPCLLAVAALVDGEPLGGSGWLPLPAIVLLAAPALVAMRGRAGSATGPAARPEATTGLRGRARARPRARRRSPGCSPTRCSRASTSTSRASRSSRAASRRGLGRTRRGRRRAALRGGALRPRLGAVRDRERRVRGRAARRLRHDDLADRPSRGSRRRWARRAACSSRSSRASACSACSPRSRRATIRAFTSEEVALVERARGRGGAARSTGPARPPRS